MRLALLFTERLLCSSRFFGFLVDFFSASWIRVPVSHMALPISFDPHDTGNRTVALIIFISVLQPQEIGGEIEACNRLTVISH